MYRRKFFPQYQKALPESRVLSMKRSPSSQGSKGRIGRVFLPFCINLRTGFVHCRDIFLFGSHPRPKVSAATAAQVNMVVRSCG